MLIHHPFHAQCTLAIATYKAKDMRRQFMLRIKPGTFTREFDRDFTQIMYRAHLFGKRAFAQVAGCFGGKLRVKLRLAGVGKDARQTGGEFLWIIDQFAWLYPDRIALNRSGQRRTIAVDNIASFRNKTDRRCTKCTIAFEDRQNRQPAHDEQQEYAKQAHQNKQPPICYGGLNLCRIDRMAGLRANNKGCHCDLRSRSDRVWISRIRLSESSFSSIFARRSVRVCVFALAAG